MEIRRMCPLAKLYQPQEGMNLSSPEVVFMERLAAGKVYDALTLIRDAKQFTGAPPVIDAPYGRFEGVTEIRDFIEGFVKRFHADGLSIQPMFQTRGGGRSVTEMVLNFEVDGMIDQVPMFVVCDLGSRNKIEELRLYCHASYVPDLTPYRRPMFKPAHLEMGDPGLLTGAVKEYYTALHHMPHVDVERILACMHPDCVFGGYDSPENKSDHSDLRAVYERMATYIPSKVAMRYETIIDDGVTGVIEWVHVISDAGRTDLNRIALSGIAAYQRGEDGRLISIRISDYAGWESRIDWEQVGMTREEAEKINAVHTFPAGVGDKDQDLL